LILCGEEAVQRFSNHLSFVEAEDVRCRACPADYCSAGIEKDDGMILGLI
jgi:hypothetical protein